MLMNELTELQKNMGLSTQEPTEADLAKAGLLGGAYLGELRLVSQGKLVNKLKLTPGTFAYVIDNEGTALGEEVDIVIFTYRAKAVDYNNKVAFYDSEDDGFKKIYAKAGQSNSGCAAGPEFLVYLPAIKKFATYHAGSKTARKTGARLIKGKNDGVPLHGVPELIETDDYSWYGINWDDANIELEMPSVEDAKEALVMFEASAASGASVAVEDESASDREE